MSALGGKLPLAAGAANPSIEVVSLREEVRSFLHEGEASIGRNGRLILVPQAKKCLPVIPEGYAAAGSY